MKYLLLLICVAALNAQWVSDPMLNTKVSTMGSDVLVKVRMDDSNNSYLTWHQGNSEGNPYTLKAQKLDNSGMKVWDSEGVVVSNEAQQTSLTDYDMEIHPDGGFVVAYNDIRNGGLDIQASRIDADGNSLWGESGISLINTTNGFSAVPKIEIDSEGNSYVAWFFDGGNGQVILQKIDNDGNLLWGDGIILEEEQETSTRPDIKVDSQNNLLVTWSKQSGPFYNPNRNIYLQKFNQDGEPQFSEDLAITTQAGITGWLDVGFAIGSNDEVIISWDDDRDGNMESDPYFQVVDSDGNIVFEENGKILDASPAYHGGGTIPSIDENGNYFVAWWKTDVAYQVDNHIVIQKFDGTDPTWDENGKVIVTPDMAPAMLIGATSNSDKNMITYTTSIDGSVINTAVYGAMYNDAGTSLWNGDDHLLVSGVESGTVQHDYSGWENGKFVIAWEDERNNESSIYAQNINIDGTLGGSSDITENSISYNLISNYPNPFNPSTTLNLTLDSNRSVEIALFNSKGEKLFDIFGGSLKSGVSTFDIDLANFNSGIYFVRVSGDLQLMKKITLIK